MSVTEILFPKTCIGDQKVYQFLNPNCNKWHFNRSIIQLYLQKVKWFLKDPQQVHHLSHLNGQTLYFLHNRSYTLTGRFVQEI
jgi:hypothetical protein